MIYVVQDDLELPCFYIRSGDERSVVVLEIDQDIPSEILPLFSP